MIASRRFVLLPIFVLFASCAGGGGAAAESSLATPSFSIALDPASLLVEQGNAGSFLLSITPLNGFTGTINVSLAESPDGITLYGASIWVPPVLSLSQPLVLEADPSAALGATTLTLIARAGTETAFASLDLTVAPPPPPPSPTFYLSLNPLGLMLPQANSAQVELKITPQFGFQGNVAVSLEAPPEIAMTPLPMQIFLDTPTTQTLTLDVAGSTPIDNYTLKVQAVSGEIQKTADFPLIVLDGHPGTPQLGISFGIKAFHFSWASVSGTAHFKLLEKSSASASYVQTGDDIPATTTSFDLLAALYEHASSFFKLQACNGLGCVDSSEISVAAGLPAAIGYFKASNAASADHFGQAIAVSADGGTLAVGAPDENGGAANSGAVYVFARNGFAWAQQAYLKASAAGNNHRFGAALAISADGNTVIVGAPDEGGGAAHLFRRNGSIWALQNQFTASNAETGDGFGSSLALSSDGATLAVGAPFEDGANNSISNSGAAYLFADNGGSWSEQACLRASNPDSGDHFGSCVALSADGGTLVVGADEENGGANGINGDETNDSAANAGAAYVFVRNGSTWSQQAYVKASNTAAGAYFGSSASLAADGNTLAIGAHNEGGGGAAYVFSRSGASWSQEALLKAAYADPSDGFGRSVSLSAGGNSLAVGAQGEDGSSISLGGKQDDNLAADSGAAYLFLRTGTIWNLQSYLKAPNTNSGDRFGIAISLSGDGKTLAIGADYEDSNATGIGGDQGNNGAQNAGAAYLY